jgi:hypothetical protein
MNNADHTPTWKEIQCASLPVPALAALADLRGRAEIQVLLAADRAWICWPAEPGLIPELMARRILSVEGVELFTLRAGEWYRLGDHLPAFGVPFRGGTTGVPLDRMVVPSKLSVLRPRDGVSNALCVRLVRDAEERVRPATAFRCALPALAAWALQATTAELSHLQAAWLAPSDGENGSAEVLVIGGPGTLPLLPESVRYWGVGLLIPLGFRSDPDLPEAAIRGVAGAGDGDLAVLDDDGLELIAREWFKPLTRAAVRLAHRSVAGPEGESRA